MPESMKTDDTRHRATTAEHDDSLPLELLVGQATRSWSDAAEGEVAVGTHPPNDESRLVHWAGRQTVWRAAANRQQHVPGPVADRAGHQ